MCFRTNDTFFQTNGFRTNDTFSGQWVFGPMGFRTNGPSDQWVFGPMGRRTNGLSDHRHGHGHGHGHGTAMPMLWLCDGGNAHDTRYGYGYAQSRVYIIHLLVGCAYYLYNSMCAIFYHSGKYIHNKIRPVSTRAPRTISVFKHSHWSNSRVTSPIAIFSRTASATWPVEV